EGEAFYLAIYFDKSENVEVRGVGNEAGNKVYFRVTSDTLSFEELSSRTNLSPVDGWSKGQPRKQNSESKYNFSALHFDPFPNEAYEMEYKMSLLLDELEKDKDGVKNLAENFGAQISIASYRYVSSFGGIHLDKKTIRRLSDLGLEVDFDIYVVGNYFK
ncbi:MAG: DUF4279 domain-containing protein, partial [Ferruginibacter sp.]|nr:DUF4279 domain-containing protein [Cytophagales bacterium]